MDGRSPTVSNLTSSKRKRPAVRLGVFITLSEDFSVTSKILSLLLRSGLGNGSMISVSPKPDAQCLLQVDLRNETVAEFFSAVHRIPPEFQFKRLDSARFLDPARHMIFDIQ